MTKTSPRSSRSLPALLLSALGIHDSPSPFKQTPSVALNYWPPVKTSIVIIKHGSALLFVFDSPPPARPPSEYLQKTSKKKSKSFDFMFFYTLHQKGEQVRVGGAVTRTGGVFHVPRHLGKRAGFLFTPRTVPPPRSLKANKVSLNRYCQNAESKNPRQPCEYFIIYKESRICHLSL